MGATILMGYEAGKDFTVLPDAYASHYGALRSNPNIRYLATAKQDVFNTMTNKDSALPLFVAKYDNDIYNLTTVGGRLNTCKIYYAKPYSEDLVEVNMEGATCQWGMVVVNAPPITPPDETN